MSSIQDTIKRYNLVCREENVSPCKFIKKMLDIELKECEGDEGKGDFHECMHLNLGGNNQLLTDTRITDQDVYMLYKTLCNNLYVSSIDLRYNNITDAGAEWIAKLLLETSVLREINLMCNDIETTGAQHLAKALERSESVVSVRLNGNKIGNKGGMYFAQMLQVNEMLEHLDLGDSDQGTESIIALATVLSQNMGLRHLNANRPLLYSHQEETTVHMANMLKVNSSLREIHLQKYDMRDFGATRLAECLMHNSTLRYLNLSCNRITRDGAKELARLLKQNTPLEVLDLGYNRLEDDGAMHLAEALGTYNTSLNTLVITTNSIGSKGLCAIADCMKMNSTLLQVYIWGNNLEEPAAIAFHHLLKSDRLEPRDTDVQPYIVDGKTILSELSHQIRRHYYYKPVHGGDVPPIET